MADDSSLSQLHKAAVGAALNCQWEEVLRINSEILEQEPENSECLNRIAKAYFEMGNYSQAKTIYQQVLTLDPYNTIAEKNLKKVGGFKHNNGIIPKVNTVAISPSLFIEEPGMYKAITLIKVAEPQRLLLLSSGTIVNLIPKNRGISVTDPESRYIGVLPDDIAFHLLKLIKGGNKYQAFIKSIKSNSVTILVKEVFRSKKFRNQVSFLEDSKVEYYASDHLTKILDEQQQENEDRVDLSDG